MRWFEKSKILPNRSGWFILNRTDKKWVTKIFISTLWFLLIGMRNFFKGKVMVKVPEWEYSKTVKKQLTSLWYNSRKHQNSNKRKVQRLWKIRRLVRRKISCGCYNCLPACWQWCAWCRWEIMQDTSRCKYCKRQLKRALLQLIHRVQVQWCILPPCIKWKYVQFRGTIRYRNKYRILFSLYERCNRNFARNKAVRR